MPKSALASALIISSLTGVASAAQESTTLSPLDRARLDLFLGPTNTVATSYVPPVGEIELISASVRGLDSCDGDIGLTMSNAFTDGTIAKIYENFDKAVQGILSVGGAIFIGSLYVQKSNPGLYKLITDGISISMDDYFGAIASCEAMVSAASTFVPDKAYEYGKNQAMENYVKEHGEKMSDINITEFLKPSSDEPNILDEVEKGFRWYSKDDAGLVQVGGLDEKGNVKYAEMTGVAARIGFCILRGIPEDLCYPDPDKDAGKHAVNPNDEIATDPLLKVIFDRDKKKANQVEVQEVANLILGATYTASCPDCSTMRETGIGIRGWYAKEREIVASKISAQVGINLSTIKQEELNEMGAPGVLDVSLEHIRALNNMEHEKYTQSGYINGLAMDVAYQRAIAVSSYLQRMMKETAKLAPTKEAKLDGAINTEIEELRVSTKELVEELRASGYTPRMYSYSLLNYLETNKLNFVGHMGTWGKQ